MRGHPWAWVKDGVVEVVHPPTASEDDVRAHAAGRDVVQVAEGVQPGDLVGADPEELPPPSFGPLLLDAELFRYRFTVPEEASIEAAAETDPLVRVSLSRLRSPRLQNVDLRNRDVIEGVWYLTAIDDPLAPGQKILTPDRAAEILDTGGVL